MNRVLIIALSLAFCLGASPFHAVEDSKTQVFLDKYYSKLAQFRSEQMACVLAKHPDWKQSMGLWLSMYEADDALYRRVFVYYQQTNPEALQWCKGQWFLSVFVCGCGKEGRVPIKDFDDLLVARGKAEEDFRQALGEFDAFRKVSETLSDTPLLRDSALWARLVDLEPEFDAILRRPNKATVPTPASVTPAADEPAAAQF